MKLRVEISPENIQIVQLEALPDTVEEMKTVLHEKCRIEVEDIVIQYKDKDFGEFVNLTNTNEIEHLMSLKVIKVGNTQPPEYVSDPGPECETSNLRKSGWPREGYTTLPSFDLDVNEALKSADNTFSSHGSLTSLTKQVKSKILDRLASQVYAMNPYPDRKQLTEVAAALVKAHPGVGDKVSPQGCEVWVNSLTYKMGAYRSTMRKYGSKELKLNSDRRSFHHNLNPEALPPAKAIKKARRGEVNWQPDYPDGEDDTSMENHRQTMISEMKHARPNCQLLSRLMALTYARRRMDVNAQMSVETVKDSWPALFRHAEASTMDFNGVAFIHVL